MERAQYIVWIVFKTNSAKKYAYLSDTAYNSGSLVIVPIEWPDEPQYKVAIVSEVETYNEDKLSPYINYKSVKGAINE